jgi:hypothetical protein
LKGREKWTRPKTPSGENATRRKEKVKVKRRVKKNGVGNKGDDIYIQNDSHGAVHDAQ